MLAIKQKLIFQMLTAAMLGAAFFIFLPQGALAQTDSDSDGLPDSDEINIYRTDPNQADTDADGFNDYEEIYAGFSPRHKGQIKLSSLDSDSDGLPDSWEIRLRLDLLNPDTDGDGFSDGTEVNSGFDPSSKDPIKIDKTIKVSLDKQELRYFFGATELDKFLISSGVARMPSPEGEFTILDKVPSKDYGGRGYNFYYPNTKWNLHFTTRQYRYYVHGAYWHNNFGHPMSHGCINVSYLNMERLYNFAQVGTKLEIS